MLGYSGERGGYLLFSKALCLPSPPEKWAGKFRNWEEYVYQVVPPKADLSNPQSTKVSRYIFDAEVKPVSGLKSFVWHIE